MGAGVGGGCVGAGVGGGVGGRGWVGSRCGVWSRCAACLVLSELSEHGEERHEDRAAADARGGGEHGRGEDGNPAVDVLLPDGEEADLLHIVHELDRAGAEPGVAGGLAVLVRVALGVALLASRRALGVRLAGAGLVAGSRRKRRGGRAVRAPAAPLELRAAAHALCEHARVDALATARLAAGLVRVRALAAGRGALVSRSARLGGRAPAAAGRKLSACADVVRHRACRCQAHVERRGALSQPGQKQNGARHHVVVRASALLAVPAPMRGSARPQLSSLGGGKKWSGTS